MGIFHSGPLRAPGAQQTTFADAQTMDMLAVAAGMDSLAFRLQNMQHRPRRNQRWSAVLQAAATAADWKPWVAGSNLSKENIVTGRGIANSHHGGAYAAVRGGRPGEQEDRARSWSRISTRRRTPASR